MRDDPGEKWFQMAGPRKIANSQATSGFSKLSHLTRLPTTPHFTHPKVLQPAALQLRVHVVHRTIFVVQYFQVDIVHELTRKAA